MSDLLNRIHPLIRIPKFYGLIAGVLGFVLLTILYYIDRHPLLVNPLFDFRIALFGIFIFSVLKELRDYYFNGVLFFWQAIVASVLFVVTYAIVSSLLIWIFASNVPGFVIQYIELAGNQLKLHSDEAIDKMGRTAYEENLSLLRTTKSLNLAIDYFLKCFPFGLFVGIILSVILRRQPKN